MIYCICKKNDGTILSNTFPLEIRFTNFRQQMDGKPFLLELQGEKSKARIAEVSNDKGSVLVLTTKPKYVNRLKSFRELCSTHRAQLRFVPTI